MKAAVKRELINTFQSRFEQNIGRHPDIEWSAVQAKLEANSRVLETLYDMERTGGEPDVIGHDKSTHSFTYCDCSPESPKGRRSLCYDGDALDARKANKPSGNAIDMASSLGVEILTEA